MVNFIIELFTELDPSTIAQGGSFSVVLLRIFASKKLRNMLIRFLIKLIRAIMGRSRVEHHLFEERKTTDYLIQNIEMQTQLKTDIFKIIMESKVRIMTEYSEYWANKHCKEFKKLDRFDMLKRMKKIIIYIEYGKKDTLYRGYESEIRDNLIYKYGNEKGIAYFNYVYLKHFKPYSDKHNSTIDSFFKNIFLFQKFTNDALVKIFLSRISFSIVTSIDDLRFTFDGINGGLERM